MDNTLAQIITYPCATLQKVAAPDSDVKALKAEVGRLTPKAES